VSQNAITDFNQELLEKDFVVVTGSRGIWRPGIWEKLLPKMF